MLNKIKVALWGWLSLAVSLSAFAVTYVKPDATGTESGSSWADATSIDAAIKAGGVIYVAKGVYYPTETLQLSDGTELYGGFAGTGDEALDARDLANNETIISGDTNRDDKWKLYDPHTGTSNNTEIPVVKDGKINLPDFADEYETCCPNTTRYSENLKRLVTIPSLAKVTIDGVVLVGAGHAQGGYPGVFVDKNATAIVTNSRVVACRGSYPAVYVAEAGSLTFTKSSIEFCYSDNKGVIYSPVNSTLMIDDCRFIGNVRTASIPDPQGSAVICIDRGTHLKNSFFTRNYNRHSYANNTKESVCVSNAGYANENVSCTGCTFVFNSCYDTTGKMTPIVHWTVGGVPVQNCVIASNLTTVVSAESKVSAVSAFASSAVYGAADSLAIFDNKLSVTATAAAVVDAAAVMANPSEVCDLTLINSVIEDNEINVVSSDGANVAAARGVLFRPSEDPTSRRSLAVYNCTFMGSTEGSDVVYANPTEGACGAVVLNSVFGTTHPFDTTPRVVNLGVNPVTVGYGALLGAATLGENVQVLDMLVDDPLVGTRSILVEGRIPARQLGAYVPSVRTTADVCLGLRQARRVYWYRLPGSTEWVIPSNYDKEQTAPATYDASKMIGDALGETRPAGNFTVGSVQAIDELAESGHTVVVRIDPADAGRVEGELTRVVPADGRESFNAVSTNLAYSFNSWCTIGGDVVSTDNPYVISSPGQGATLIIAQFYPTSVTYTFDLGTHGTFDVSGLAVTNVVFEPGESVVVPAYTLEEGYALRRWSPNLPEKAGAVDLTITAEYVRRVTRVETDGGLADALAAAAAFPGEAKVVLAAGTHTLASSVALPGNVTLVGEDGAVIEGGSGVAYAIDGRTDADLAASYSVSNVTFFRSGVNPGAHPSTFRNCTFMNATDRGGWAAIVAYTNVMAENCVFLNNKPVLHALTHISGYYQYPVIFKDCTFNANANGVGYVNYEGQNKNHSGVVICDNSDALFTNCVFTANTNTVQASGLGILFSGDYGRLKVAGCRFDGNVSSNAISIVSFGNYGSGHTIEDSLFSNNRVVGDRGKNSSATASLIGNANIGKVSIKDSSFVNNAVDRTEAETLGGVSVLPCALIDAKGTLPALRNCYFEGNFIRATPTNPSVSGSAALMRLTSGNEYYDLACCNNTFYANEAAQGVFFVSAKTTKKIFVSNTIFRDVTGAYPFVFSDAATVTIEVANSVITAQDDERINYTNCKDAVLEFGPIQKKQGRLVRGIRPMGVLYELGGEEAINSAGGPVFVKVGGSWRLGCGMSSQGSAINLVRVPDMFGIDDSRDICGAYRKIKFDPGSGFTIFIR